MQVILPGWIEKECLRYLRILSGSLGLVANYDAHDSAAWSVPCRRARTGSNYAADPNVFESASWSNQSRNSEGAENGLIMYLYLNLFQALKKKAHEDSLEVRCLLCPLQGCGEMGSSSRV
jgi:hypothetical protein